MRWDTGHLLKKISKYSAWGMGLGVFTIVALNLFFNLIEPGRNYFFISSFVDRTVYYLSALLSMLSFLYVLLYTFRFSWNKRNRLMEVLNRNSYPVYIIQVIVLGLIAWIMIPLPVSPGKIPLAVGVDLCAQ